MALGGVGPSPAEQALLEEVSPFMAASPGGAWFVHCVLVRCLLRQYEADALSAMSRSRSALKTAFMPLSGVLSMKSFTLRAIASERW